MKHPYVGLWLLLAIALGFFTYLSSLDEIKIFGLEFKPSGLYEAVAATPAKNQDTATALKTRDKINTQGQDKDVTEKAKCDTTAKNILFIGDSMLEGLSPRMAAYAKANGHKIHSVIWYSSTSEVWGRSNKLRGYISKFKPDFIIICLGANELFVRNIKEKRLKYVKAILKDIGNIPYVWIGPPNWKEDTGINDLISMNASRGSFFLSKNLKFDRSKDGAHPTRKSAIYWMDSVASWMTHNSAHPIKMKKPSVSTAHCPTIILQPQQ